MMRLAIAVLMLSATSSIAFAQGTPDPAAPARTAQPPGDASSVTTTQVRTTTPLMENWKFVQDDDLTDDAALASTGADWQTVSLPHTWNADAAGLHVTKPYKRGIGWYRLEFATPVAGARHWLEFGAASMVADVWLNGQKLGQHKGAFTAFRFDVTDELVESGANELLVKVDNSLPTSDYDVTAIIPLGGDFNMYGGLYRHVSLISTADPVHFDLADFGGPGVYATTTAIAGGDATVNVRAKLKSDADRAADYVVRATLLEADGRVAQSAQRTVPLEAGGSIEVAQDLVVANVRLWQGVEDPYQYTLVAELLRPDGAVIDKVVQDFGIRQMHFDPDEGFFLNGRHVRLRGVAIHQDYLGKGWAMTKRDFDESFALIEEIGANTVRLGHYPFARYALESANRLGLVVWSELPVSLGVTTEVIVAVGESEGPQCPQRDATPAFRANARQQLQELIRQQYNHAAVAMWSVGNEVTFMHRNCKETWYDNITPVLRELHALAKHEDPSRVTALADFTEDIEQPLAGGYIGLGGNTDVWATNQYHLWYGGPVSRLGAKLDVLHARYPDQPLGVSEYGAGAALSHHTDNVRGGRPEVNNTGQPVIYQPEEYASYVHEQNYAMLESKEYLWGTYVWNLFDFGSGIRNEGDLRGVNTKGLVTFDRKTRKDPFYFYKANWSSEPVTYITGRRYTDRAYPVADVKVYSNADSVRLSVNGEPVGSMPKDRCMLRACVFEGVRLSPGVNRVVAVGDHGGRSVSDSVEWVLNTDGINIAAGQLATGFTSSAGARFGSDNFFIGGEGAWLVPRKSGDAADRTPVSGTADPELFKTYRSGAFSYYVPLADGAYEVTLGFLEPDRYTEVGHRVFDVVANGETKLDNFDVLEAAGKYRTAVSRTFTVAVSGGHLKLDFVPVRGEAVVSNIMIERPGGTAAVPLDEAARPAVAGENGAGQ